MAQSDKRIKISKSETHQVSGSKVGAVPVPRNIPSPVREKAGAKRNLSTKVKKVIRRRFLCSKVSVECSAKNIYCVGGLGV